jgi:SRSO17 transposase
MKSNEQVPARQRRFDEFIGILASAMGHADRLAPLHGYCAGLLVHGDRKSVEPMAARISPGSVSAQHQSMLHLVGVSPWDDDDVLSAVREYVLPDLRRKSADLTLQVDDTSIVKKGKLSVGVARQYCGQLGKQENCQVAVSLTVANEFGSLPLAYRLYLPEMWAKDRERRKVAKVPQEVEFLTKPQIALLQIEQAVKCGITATVLADAGYGNDSKFREGVTDLGQLYAVGIQSTTTLWPPDIDPLPTPPYQGRGRPRKSQRAPGHEPVSGKELAEGLPPQKYREVSWREGTRSKMRSRFARVRVHSAHRDYGHPKTAPAEWLLIEWPKSEKEPTKYWLSTLPEDTPIETLVRKVKERWRIERDYQELKDEVGLDHYEGRGWRGFHHHATLSIAAYAFLMKERLFSPSREAGAEPVIELQEVPEDYRPRGAARSDRAS